MICSKILKKLVVFIHMWVLCTSIHVKASNDSMKPGDTLNATSEVCSKQGKYCMGFGSVSKDKNHTYLRIYAKKGNWLVWENRNQPSDLDSAALSLDHTGVLKIESKTGKSVILYSSPQPLNNNTEVVATLLDTGNFVVQQIQPNNSIIVLWQSFDYPADSLVPGMKLGVNHKTGHSWSVAADLSDSIVASGPFRLEWEPKREELIIKHREQVYWTSGKLRNNSKEYKIVSNKDEDYFTLTTTTNEDIIWTLLPTGQLINRDGHDVARADMCYGYNTDGGCQKWEEIPTCRYPGDVFVSKTGYPNYTMMTILPNATFSENDCQAICWNNCSCAGFRYYDTDGIGCEFFPSLEGANFGGSGDFFSMLVRNTHQKGKKKWIWISAVIAAALLIACPPILCIALKKLKYRLKEKKTKKMESMMLDSEASNESSAIKDLEDELKGHNFKVFNYTSILAATTNFSLENKLGQGGYGPVYKGILPTGQEVAVKRLSKTSAQGIVEFKNELSLICELQHKNLVQLLGCCIHDEDRILIYEYMPNKSLDFYLFDCTRRKFLDWKKRFNIKKEFLKVYFTFINTQD